MDTTNRTIIAATSPLDIDWSKFTQYTSAQRDALAVELQNWVLAQTDAVEALRAFEHADSSRRVGVWLACAAARSVLHHIPIGDDRPRVAIETTERWVRGQSTVDECREVAALIRARHQDESASAYAAYDACASTAEAVTGEFLAGAVSGAASSIAAYHRATSGITISWRDARAQPLRELCGVIARELRTALEAASEGYTRHPISR